MTYIEALAPYTQPQQMKLAFLVLRKLNAYRGDQFNMIAEAHVDQHDGAPLTTDDLIETAHEIWASADLGGEGFAGSDQAIDLQPLVKWMKRNGVWVDRPKGWSNAA